MIVAVISWGWDVACAIALVVFAISLAVGDLTVAIGAGFIFSFCGTWGAVTNATYPADRTKVVAATALMFAVTLGLTLAKYT